MVRQKPPKTPRCIQSILLSIMIGAGFFSFCLGTAESADFLTGHGESLYSSLDSGSGGNFPDNISGAIKGRAAAEDTGVGLAHMEVFAKQTDSFLVKLVEISSGEVHSQAPLQMRNSTTYEASTELDGVFHLENLPPGVYTVWTHEEYGSYLQKRYGGPGNEPGAGLVLVEGGLVRDIGTLSVQKGGSVEGSITGAADGQAVGNVRVAVLDAVSQKTARTAFSDIAGNYIVKGLPDGTYVVKTSKTGLLDSYYGEKENTPSEAITIRDNSRVMGIDFSLARSASVCGVVNGPENTALSGVRVSISAYKEDTKAGRPLKYVRSEKGGVYCLDGIPAGRYVLEAEASAVYLPAVYKKERAESVPTAVSLHGGQKRTGMNFNLIPGGTIRGKVVHQATGKPLAKVSVKVHDTSTGKISGHTATDKEGRYSIDRFPAGTYTVTASSEEFGLNYYDNVIDVGEAAGVHISPGMVLKNIDFSLLERHEPHTGKISGKIVWAHDLSEQKGGCVQAYRIASKNIAGSNCSDTDGHYAVAALPDGDYRLFVRGFSGFISEFYKDIDSTAPDNAVTVSILNGAHIDDIDFVLSRIGKVTGRVYRNADMEELGTYEIKGIPGDYLIALTSAGSGYRAVGMADEKMAVTIHDGQTTKAEDIILTVDVSSL